MAASSLPVNKPILPHISWTATMEGYKKITVHNKPNPNFAPAWANVAILEGSSSAEPVMIPGPKDFKKILMTIEWI